MLNEACDKAQEASILSAAVMLLIKEHGQGVITGHTLGVYRCLATFGTDAVLFVNARLCFSSCILLLFCNKS